MPPQDTFAACRRMGWLNLQIVFYAPLNRKIKHIRVALIDQSALAEPKNQLVVMD